MDAYDSFDVFAFASQSETQGLVLSEAMAAGVPVVALEGPGVNDVVRDGWNGRLLSTNDYHEFAAALAEMAALPSEARRRYVDNARQTAVEFSKEHSADLLLNAYIRFLSETYQRGEKNHSPWKEARRRIAKELKIITNMAKATGKALGE